MRTSETKKLIQGTKTYGQLNPIAQKMMMSHNGIKAMAHNLSVAQHLGFEKFDAQSAATHRNKLIVKEILENGTATT